MQGEIWTYLATKPNNTGEAKVRPVLVIGDDSNNQLQYVDIHYVIISSSAECGIYDILLDKKLAKELGLARESIIKTTKIYTGPRSKLGVKIAELPSSKKEEFVKKYQSYQDDLISKLYL